MEADADLDNLLDGADLFPHRISHLLLLQRPFLCPLDARSLDEKLYSLYISRAPQLCPMQTPWTVSRTLRKRRSAPLSAQMPEAPHQGAGAAACLTLTPRSIQRCLLWDHWHRAPHPGSCRRLLPNSSEIAGAGLAFDPFADAGKKKKKDKGKEPSGAPGSLLHALCPSLCNMKSHAGVGKASLAT